MSPDPLEAPLLFVVGNSRSGTTLMSRILGNHPEVFAFHELHFFEQVWIPTPQPPTWSAEQAQEAAATLLGIQRDGFFAPRRPERYRDEARALIASIAQPLTAPRVFAATLAYECARHGKRIACEQTPRNVFYLNEILAYYPNARAIQMVRDPRDVLLSQKRKWKRRFLGAGNIPLREAVRAWINYHPRTISMLWRAAIDAGAALADHPRLHTVHFEQLLSSPEAELRKLCAFLEIDYQPAMLDVPQVGSSSGRDAGERRGLAGEAKSRWRQGGLTDAEVAICQALTARQMAQLGYLPEPIRAPRWRQLALEASWPLKTGLALAANLRRSRNLLRAIRKRLAPARNRPGNRDTHLP